MGEAVEVKEERKQDPAMARKRAMMALKQQNDDAVRACLADIRSVLERHGCELVATPHLDQGLIAAAIGCRLKPQA